MTGVKLTYGGLSYFDRTLALELGNVVPSGIELAFRRFVWPGELFRLQTQGTAFDASEMSLSTFIMLTSRGDRRFVGLPLYISRNFRHRDIYVHGKSGIEAPGDLRGRRVGILEYQITAALWIRAFLQHDFGISPTDITWFEGGLTQPGFIPRSSDPHPEGVDVRRIPEDRTLEGMLEAGELDALISVQPPQSMFWSGSSIRRLFMNYHSVEAAYYRRTGVFPVMHLVVLDRALYERHPFVAESLCTAFSEAKKLGRERLREVTGLAVSLPWLPAHLEEVDRLFKGDPFPYGVEENRVVLESALDYSYEQGLSKRRVGLEEIVASEFVD